MTRGGRTALLAAGALTLAPATTGAAETEGRISLTNAYTQVSGPDATFDTALVRIWLRSERLAGRKIGLFVDSRTDVSVLADPGKKLELGGTSVFNEQCRGDAEGAPTPACKDVPLREQRFGQLLQVQGIYDLFVRFGEAETGRMTVSVGRKTFYEAGLATVDGVAVEKQLDRARWGIFGGLAPNPISRAIGTDFQAAGGYYAFNTDAAWVRLGSVAQLFQAELDRISIYNHDFWGISRSLRLAAIVALDVVPGPQERLVQVDLTYRPSGQYRVRASLMRFRPWDYDVSTAHIIQPPEDLLVDDFRSATRDPASIVRGKFRYRDPEVLDSALRTSAVNQAKLMAQYTTTRSLTPYLSLAFRTREIDSKSGLSIGGGVYAYDFYDTGVVGRLAIEHLTGFDYDADRLLVTVERRMSEAFVFGVNAQYGAATYTERDSVLNAGYPKASTLLGGGGVVRYDLSSSISVAAQADYRAESRDVPAPPPNSGLAPDRSSGEISVMATVTYRL